MPGRFLLAMGAVLLIALPGFAQDAMVGGDEDGGVIAYVSVSEYERATGRTMPAYSESPMLTALVDDGTLPPVEQRLPDDPAVAVPLESVGVYGGTAKFDGTFFRSLLKRGLFTRDVNGAEIRTDLGMGYEVNDDYTQYRIFLRPGAKWSDGEDFTSADIMFWWNDQMNNDELTPHGPTWIWANAELSAVDDYTIQVDLSVPQPTLMASLSHPFAASRSHFFVAEHFQRQYHIDYNEDANKLASEQGFESWTQLYNHWKASWVFQQRPGIPTLNTWIVTDFTETEYLAERNPYFWQVDTAGNQLPYIDTLIAPYSGDAQTKLLRAIGGDLDYLSGFSILAVSDFPLMKENEAAGNYRVQTLKGDYQSAFTVGFNPVVKDPVLHDIFRDIRFRQALSLAIDRDALNESVFFGLATPRQVAPLPNVSFYDEAWGDYFIEYDVDRANQLLDEMGLGWDADGKLRLRPDGKPMNILMESGHGSAPEATVAEVIKNMWEDVGVTLTIKPEKITHQRLQEGELYEMLIVDGGGASTEMDLQGWVQLFWEVGGGGHSWNRWVATNGEGENVTEPPQEWLDLWDRVQEAGKLVPGTPEWIERTRETWDWRIKQLWHIGTVYAAPVFQTVSNDLHNVPSGFWFGWSIGFHPLLQSSQWYLDR